MKKRDIDEFDTLLGQLESFYREMNTLAKKSPNDALNKFKLSLLNTVLKKANVLLGKGRLPFPDFEIFDEAGMPSTSDALVIASQYLNAFEKLRTDNIYRDYSTWYWKVDDQEGLLIETPPPKRLDE